jgi:molecular chaperone HscB
MTMNYFEFYELPVAFQLDETALRQRFLSNSKKFHPDFFAQESEAKQSEILGLSSLNNEAYRVLLDPDQRMKYILEQKGLLLEGKNEIPQAFLLEMMDINEALMELEFDFSADALENIQDQLDLQTKSIQADVQAALDNYADGAPDTDTNLKKIKDFYLKNRYLLRIRENLSKFADR